MLGKTLNFVTYGVFVALLIFTSILYRSFRDLQIAMTVQQDIARVCVVDLLETRQHILHNQCVILKALAPQEGKNSPVCEGVEYPEQGMLSSITTVPKKEGKP